MHICTFESTISFWKLNSWQMFNLRTGNVCGIFLHSVSRCFGLRRVCASQCYLLLSSCGLNIVRVSLCLCSHSPHPWLCHSFGACMSYVRLVHHHSVLCLAYWLVPFRQSFFNLIFLSAHVWFFAVGPMCVLPALSVFVSALFCVICFLMTVTIFLSHILSIEKWMQERKPNLCYSKCRWYIRQLDWHSPSSFMFSQYPLSLCVCTHRVRVCAGKEKKLISTGRNVFTSKGWMEGVRERE